MKKNIYKIVAVFVLSAFIGCSSSDLEPTLAQSKSLVDNVNTEEDLVGLINGAHNILSEVALYGRNYIIMNELRADNTYANGTTSGVDAMARMDVLPESSGAVWLLAYKVIATTNIIINAEGITGDASKINFIKGQAHAIRALAHFNLLKVYGQQHVTGGDSTLGVPYVTTFEDSDNYFPARNTVEHVKTMAYEDIETALSLMEPRFNSNKSETITTFAVNAIKAKMALYFGDKEMAKQAAWSVISSGRYSIPEANKFADTFSSDSAANSVFEIAFDSQDNPGIDGLANMYRGSYGDVVVLQDLKDIYDADDVRGSDAFIKTTRGGIIRNVGKYPSSTHDDNVSVIRYEEVILIYAEAILETDPGNALMYLNMVPNKRGLINPYTEATLDNILLERRKEFAFEGMRFHDLARTKRDIPLVDEVNQTHGGPTYGSYNYAYPIPYSEVSANSNMVQNFGYN